MKKVSSRLMRAHLVTTEASNDTKSEDVPIYTCAMHPEVVSNLSGSYPVCNTALFDQQSTSYEHHHRTTVMRVGYLNSRQFDTVPDAYGGTIYTCPMHPEVRHPGRSTCPLCGMGLEPEKVSLEVESRNQELIDFTSRLWIGVALSVSLFVLSIGPPIDFDYASSVFSEHVSLWLQFALATPVVL